jgi:sirohydrochlorin cobaltochelatase
VFGAANPHAAETGRPKKTGILLAAFGTTITGAHAAYEKIEARVKAEFPEIPVRWAYTSKKVRKKLARAGKTFDSPSLALASMKDENFTRVAVLSLHVIPGYEYHELVRAARAFSEPPKVLLEVRLTHPLLGDPQGMEAAAGALMSMAPADRAERDAVIFIGHGTHHPANAFYPAMQYHLWREDELAFVGAIQGAPSLENVMRELESAKAGKAYLLPLMTVAGDHARKDVAGDGPDSWKSRLEASGIETVAVLKGAGEYDAVIDIWIEHLRGALNSFE